MTKYSVLDSAADLENEVVIRDLATEYEAREYIRNVLGEQDGRFTVYAYGDDND